jgi:hypothetical protein
MTVRKVTMWTEIRPLYGYFITSDRHFISGIMMEQVPKEYRNGVQREATRRVELNNESLWSVTYWFITSKKVRRMAVLIGAISTLLPWYLSENYSFSGLYLNLFSGLYAANNLGLEFAAMLFFIGLLMLSYRGQFWSMAGGAVMLISLVMSMLSVQGFPTWGAGVYVGLFVIIYAFLPVFNFMVGLSEPYPLDQ